MEISKQLLNRLNNLKEQDFKDFSEKIVCSNYPLLGVRSCYCKAIAKELSESNNYDSFIKSNHFYYEEYLIIAYLIGFLKVDLSLKINYIKYFIKYVNCWSLCDCLVANLKIKESDKEKFYNFAIGFIVSPEVYEKRFAIVSLLDYFVTDDYIERVLKICKLTVCNDYYEQMAMAWIVCECLVKQYDKTLPLLESKSLSTFVHNKSIQKAVESLRISKDKKEYLKTLKIKNERR